MNGRANDRRARGIGRCDGLTVHAIGPNSRRGLTVHAIGPNSRRGFTLIEVIVAFAVLALALAIVLGTLSNAARQVRWSEDAGRAALHAQSLLDDVGVATTLVPGRSEGVLEDGRYRWTLRVEPWRDPVPRDEAATPQSVDPAAPRLLRLALDIRWGAAADDPRNRLHLESLRFVRPDTAAASPP
jgi:general secretion pathway protein I